MSQTPPKGKLADRIKESLCKFLVVGGYDIVIPNFYIHGSEMDILKLTPAGVLSEYEIKISRADFKADLNKNTGWKDGGGKKHHALSGGRRACNKFYFVVPEDLITVEECPRYAGLIYYHPDYHYDFTYAKTAPTLHKEKDKIPLREIASRLAFRERHLKGKVNWSQHIEKENHKRLVTAIELIEKIDKMNSIDEIREGISNVRLYLSFYTGRD